MTTEMNKLDEIALTPLPDLPAGIIKHAQLGELYDRLQVHQYAVAYADQQSKALLAELSKDAEPVLWTTTSLIGTSTMQDENYPVPLFTHPANTAEIEQRVAEACAKVIRNDESGRDGAGYFADILLDGKWREYL